MFPVKLSWALLSICRHEVVFGIIALKYTYINPFENDFFAVFVVTVVVFKSTDHGIQ